ncbi:hypothetical protein SGLAM104S_03878 [Streptomyces glaucescens]
MGLGFTGGLDVAGGVGVGLAPAGVSLRPEGSWPVPSGTSWVPLR